MVKLLNFLLFMLLSLHLFASEAISSNFSLSNNEEIPSPIKKTNKTPVLYATTNVALSVNKLTPGQQLTLTIEINFADDVEITTDASQVSWQPFTLLSHHKNSPQWLGNEGENGRWKIDYTIDLIVPLAGEYQLPEMILHSYLKQQHQRQFIQWPKILVTSSFSSEVLSAQIQPIEKMIISEDAISNNYGTLITTTVFSLVIIMWIIIAQKNKPKEKKRNVPEKNVPLPSELIIKANEKGKYDWEDLRQCMLQHLGFDPLDVHINSQHLALSNRYISARFTDDNHAMFIELCRVCQSTNQVNASSNGINTENNTLSRSNHA